MKSCKWFAMILLTSFLTACGGGGGSDEVADSGSNDTVFTTSNKTGIAVDPYIFNARFDEFDASGKLLQTSNYSDKTGRFSFGNAISDGSTIQIRSSATVNSQLQAQHAGERYTGVIKREFAAGDELPVVVSPLTTLLANGMSPRDILAMLSAAGLNGLTESSLYDDPLAVLINKTGNITNDELVLLQANMAVNVFMEAINNFNYGSVVGADDSKVRFNDIAAMVKDNLNPTLYENMVSANSTVTVGDMANNAVIINRIVVGKIQGKIASGDPSVPVETINQFREDAMAATLPPAPSTPPVAGRTGQQVFDQECGACHAMDTYDTTSPYGIDLVGQGNNIIAKIEGGHKNKNQVVTSVELTALADFADAFAPPVVTTPPGVDRSGNQVFDQECGACHALGTHDTSSIYGDLAGRGTAIIAKIDGGHQSKNQVVTVGELTALADFADTFTPHVVTTPPGVDRSGDQVFDQECGACHAMDTYDTTSPYGIDLAGRGTAIIAKIDGGHQNKNQAVTAGELTALADFADTFTPPVVTTPPACGSCHSLPPTGSEAGAHAVHTALNGVGNTCDNCHPTDTVHPSGGLVNLGFAAKWNAKSGPAADNGDGTCSSIICHGGKKTPAWFSGSINVDTQCSSCHASGTSQYNGYSSGEHQKHVSDKGFACSECHDTAKLQVGHFTNLSTPGFEQSPASTLKNAMNYNSQNQTCNLSCHGKSHNPEQW